jgi:hypothetical protein
MWPDAADAQAEALGAHATAAQLGDLLVRRDRAPHAHCRGLQFAEGSQWA